ncbi:stAR-related lipid transfer protein 9 isoform X1 [Lepisosteus oculatus]|uniref:stAR-related lipid transfer protein 9 isoform X1 n=1 Tax=Lepisosteus oculatus TaxID=7918 RepID=UPI00371B78A9
MANVKVAIRVRPLSTRESADGGQISVQVENKVVQIKNIKLDGRIDGLGDSREKLMEFGFDYCYWSVDPEAPDYASQEVVFRDLGAPVLAGAAEGYNVCLFAYGQTGSGKTYTMIGTPTSVGLTPRICEGLFTRDDRYPEGQNSCRVEISFLEIYNERVRDLLRRPEQKKPFTLRVREHPEKGPYVQGLSQHVVSDYKQAVELLEEGIANRITAATHVHDASSRSHAIFTIHYTQAILENNLPSEIVSKINLVDLAGSERADPHYCRDRITEGSNINKSLVTLGIVISSLAQNSQMFSSCQSINSVASEGEGSTAGSHSSSLSGGGRRSCYIPYRDSVLTWLLKDSLGGNSKTIMIATVSPSSRSYSETLSTLRYAAHARNIVNKPRVNEDANVKLIRELREEIDRLKAMLMSFEMRNPSPSFSEDRDGNLSDIVLQNELKIEQLTKDWSNKWRDRQELLEQYRVDINRDRAGVQIDSHLPHLIALEGDILSTGVTLYHLREGVTRIGSNDEQDEAHIVLQGPAVDGVCCEIVNEGGVVTLRPVKGCICVVNEREVTEPSRLAQGAVIVLGGGHRFRFNHPAEAAILRQRRQTSEVFLSSRELLSRHPETRPSLPWDSRRESVLAPPGKGLEDSGAGGGGCWERSEAGAGGAPRRQLAEQQRYVQSLREEIQSAQRRAERDLEWEQAHLQQQHRDNQQWIQQESQRLANEERKTSELGVQTDPTWGSEAGVQVMQGSGVCETPLGKRKKLVQQELLRHHALRRSEFRVRRKRLRYQLEKIARKRHFLEAKRELQQLESAFALSRESPTSPDLTTELGGAVPLLRRHSFSADLLSRLYPNQTPIYSHFLARNKSTELPPPSGQFKSSALRKWLSEECLPAASAKRMRNCSETSTTGLGQVLRCEMGSVGNQKSQQTTPPCPDSSKGKGRALSKSSKTKCQEPTRSSSKGARISTKGNKGLERIRKALSQSVSPGIRTALSRVFRKPPTGIFINRGAKSVKKISCKLTKSLDSKTAEKCLTKMASCEDLDHLSKAGADCWHKRWHSADFLTGGIRQGTGWELGEENEEERSSDSDSMYSLDSLSSAYTKALAEQLKQEDADQLVQSDEESIDSQMSQDSLVTNGERKQSERPAVALSNTEPCSFFGNPYSAGNSHSWQARRVSLDSLAGDEERDINFSPLGSATSDEMPVEIYWKRQSPRIKAGINTKALKENAFLQQMKPLFYQGGETKEETGERVCKLRDDPCLKTCPSSANWRTYSREEESLLALTDAWSSSETNESPRILQDTNQEVANMVKGSPKRGAELSDSMSSLLSSGFERDISNACTLDSNTTLKEQSYWDLEYCTNMETILGNTLKSKTLPSIPVSFGNEIALQGQLLTSEPGINEKCSAVAECRSTAKEVPVIESEVTKFNSDSNCAEEKENHPEKEVHAKLTCSSVILPSLGSSNNDLQASNRTVSMEHSDHLHAFISSGLLYIDPAGDTHSHSSSGNLSESSYEDNQSVSGGTSKMRSDCTVKSEKAIQKHVSAQDNDVIPQSQLITKIAWQIQSQWTFKDVNIDESMDSPLSSHEQETERFLWHESHSNTVFSGSSPQVSMKVNTNSNINCLSNQSSPIVKEVYFQDAMSELQNGTGNLQDNGVVPMTSRNVASPDYTSTGKDQIDSFHPAACDFSLGSHVVTPPLESNNEEDADQKNALSQEKYQESPPVNLALCRSEIQQVKEKMARVRNFEGAQKAVMKENPKEQNKTQCKILQSSLDRTQVKGEDVSKSKEKGSCESKELKDDSMGKAEKQCKPGPGIMYTTRIDGQSSNTSEHKAPEVSHLENTTVEFRKDSWKNPVECSKIKTNLETTERVNILNCRTIVQDSQVSAEVTGKDCMVILDSTEKKNELSECSKEDMPRVTRVVATATTSDSQKSDTTSRSYSLLQKTLTDPGEIQDVRGEQCRIQSVLECEKEELAPTKKQSSVANPENGNKTLKSREDIDKIQMMINKEGSTSGLKHSKSETPEIACFSVDQKISEVVKEHMDCLMKESKEGIIHGREGEHEVVMGCSESNHHSEHEVLSEQELRPFSRESRPPLAGNLVSLDSCDSCASPENDLDDLCSSPQPCHSHFQTSHSPLVCVLKDAYVRVDMANFDLEGKDLSSLPLSSQDQEVLEVKKDIAGLTQGHDRENKPDQNTPKKKEPQSSERMNYVQIGNSGNSSTNVFQQTAEEKHGVSKQGDNQESADSNSKETEESHPKAPEGNESQGLGYATKKAKEISSVVEKDFQHLTKFTGKVSSSFRKNIEGTLTRLKPVSVQTAESNTSDEKRSIEGTQEFRGGTGSITEWERDGEEESKEYLSEDLLCPFVDVTKNESLDHREQDLDRPEGVREAELQPEGCYLENVASSSNPEYSWEFKRDLDVNASMPLSSSNTQNGPGAQDYLDIRMSNWTVPFDQAVQPMVNRSSQALSLSTDFRIQSKPEPEESPAFTAQIEFDRILKSSSYKSFAKYGCADMAKNGGEYALNSLEEGTNSDDSFCDVFSNKISCAGNVLLSSKKDNLLAAESEVVLRKEILRGAPRKSQINSCHVSDLNNIIPAQDAGESVIDSNAENGQWFSPGQDLGSSKNMEEQRDKENRDELQSSCHITSPAYISSEQFPEGHIHNSKGNITQAENRPFNNKLPSIHVTPVTYFPESQVSSHNYCSSHKNQEAKECIYVMEPGLDENIKVLNVFEASLNSQVSDYEIICLKDRSTGLQETSKSTCSAQDSPVSLDLTATLPRTADNSSSPDSHISAAENDSLLLLCGHGSEEHSSAQAKKYHLKRAGDHIIGETQSFKRKIMESGPQTDNSTQSCEQPTSSTLVANATTCPVEESIIPPKLLSSSQCDSAMESHESQTEVHYSSVRQKDSLDTDQTRISQCKKDNSGDHHKTKQKLKRVDPQTSLKESSSSPESSLSLSEEPSLDRPLAALSRHGAQKHSVDSCKEECCSLLHIHRVSSPVISVTPHEGGFAFETSTNSHQSSRIVCAQSNSEANEGSCVEHNAKTKHKPSLILTGIQRTSSIENAQLSTNKIKDYTTVGPLSVSVSSDEERKALPCCSIGDGSDPYLNHQGQNSKSQDQGGVHLPDVKDAMHFSSSDINPFVHPWQEKEANRVTFKNQPFGSVSDFSSQSFDCGTQGVARCCSVDNVLNIQNSPFHSHLSSFANTRGISSTLSSMEDFQRQDTFEYNHRGGSYPSCQEVLDSGSCSIGSGDLGNSSIQVDEIMVLYSSEPESTVGSCKGTPRLTCEHGTQTSADCWKRKKNRHKRSSTQVPVSQRVPEENGDEQPTSWASLQNMSFHLSQLIHNTSDLLGNIKNVQVKDASHLTPSRPKLFGAFSERSRRRDSSTQTTVDVGIQTEKIFKSTSKSTNKTVLAEERTKPPEVSVIVKVIGSEVLDISQENKDITLALQDQEKRTAVKIQSMPDLRKSSSAVLLPETTMGAVPLSIRTSTPSLETVKQNHLPFSPRISPVTSPACISASEDGTNLEVSRMTSCSSQFTRSDNQMHPRENSVHNSPCRNTSSRQVCLIDRASSPILTVEAGVNSCMVRSKSVQCLANHETSEKVFIEDSFRQQKRNRSASWYGFRHKDGRIPSEQKVSEDHYHDGNQLSKRLANRPIANTSTADNFSNPCTGEREKYSSVNTVHMRGFTKQDSGNRSNYTLDGHGRKIVNRSQCIAHPPGCQIGNLSSRQSRVSSWSRQQSGNTKNLALSKQKPAESQLLSSKLEEKPRRKPQQFSGPECELNNRSGEGYQTSSEDGERWRSPCEPSEMSERAIHLQDDDTMSVAPSECNTDVLLNINPLADDSPDSQGNCRLPEDLPMHNKFTNWSGVHYRPPSSLNSSVVMGLGKSQPRKTKKEKSGSIASGCLDSREPKDERAREIERLRKERAQVMAAVRLDLNPHQLTVELTEAKLNYGLGETDTLLKLLHTGAAEESCPMPTKEQLYDRHKKSIEGLRQERETQLQRCRRARSLSPSKHPFAQGQGAALLPKDPDTPSRHREYLQQLRQGVVDSTRVPQPKRLMAQCPSEIELLLRDYGKAREEAKTEIARARDRLRKRTEQEKKRLQQQALSQILRAQDDLRFRTRISTSTLCTGSSLSLSSGPTSGYNSSNTVAPIEGTTLALQAAESSEERAERVRGRPTVRGSQCSDAQRQWLSAHDVRLEGPGFENSARQPLVPRVRERTRSVNSISSVSGAYQEIAACTVACAMAEIRSASEGDLGNLFSGNSLGGWKYQGLEQGVLVYYKPFSSPSMHGFLGAAVIKQPLYSVWCMIRDHSKTHLYHRAVKTAQATRLDSTTQLVYVVMDTSVCYLKQPRDFCCISAEDKQEGQFVLAMRSIYDESLPRPGTEMVRGELLPSAWVLQPHTRDGKEVTRVIYMTQVDLGTPVLPQPLLGSVAKRQAMVIADLDSFFSF